MVLKRTKFLGFKPCDSLQVGMARSESDDFEQTIDVVRWQQADHGAVHVFILVKVIITLLLGQHRCSPIHCFFRIRFSDYHLHQPADVWYGLRVDDCIVNQVEERLE